MVLIKLDTVTSTNDAAKELIKSGAEHGAVITARTQSAGRGTRGRTFLSPEGGLYMSVILRPKRPVSELTAFTAEAGRAAARAIGRICPGLNPEVKPVNDVLINGAKVCGILCESASCGGETAYIIAGIGVNVKTAPDVPGARTACLGEDVEIDALRETMAEEILGIEV